MVRKILPQCTVSFSLIESKALPFAQTPTGFANTVMSSDKN